MSLKLATFPIDIAAQQVSNGIIRIDRENLRQVHTPLPVLPNVFLVGGRNDFGARCLSCNVCELCHDDAFRGEGCSEKGLPCQSMASQTRAKNDLYNVRGSASTPSMHRLRSAASERAVH
eukprot:9706599-Karenia_brevis.AAC.1